MLSREAREAIAKRRPEAKQELIRAGVTECEAAELLDEHDLVAFEDR
jgi:hypothetical protein